MTQRGGQNEKDSYQRLRTGYTSDRKGVVLMIKSILLKTIVIGACLTILPSGAAFAGTGGGLPSSSTGRLPVSLAEEAELQSDVSIKQAVKGFLPDGAKLTVPGSAEKLESFIQVDLNNDGSGEIAAFYRDGGNIGVLLLEKEDSKWQLKDQIAYSGNDLDCVGFYDLDGDERTEILIGEKGNGQNINKLIVYKPGEEGYEELYRLDYADISVGDLEGDGTLEIASIKRVELDDAISGVKLQVHSFIDGSCRQEYETLFANGGFPDNVLIGAVNENQQAIFVDMGVGAHSAVTEILVKENGEYKNVLPREEGDGLSPAFKPYPLRSKDINNDGIVEVGIQVAPPETDHLPLAAVPWINNWYQWDGEDGLTPVMEEISTRDYQFVIPDSWDGKYTIDKDLDSTVEFSSVQFVYLAGDNGKAELLALHSILGDDWEKQEEKLQNPYILLGESSYNVLVAELPPDDVELSGANLQEYKEMLLDEESLRSCFIIARESETLEKALEEIMEIEEQFISMLFRPEKAEENSNELKNYQRKEGLINDVSQIAERDLVAEFVDKYYEEKGDKLYIIPQGMPAGILFQSFYEFNQIDDNVYEIVQDEADVMRGAYRLTVRFTNADNRWRMVDRTTEFKQLSNEEFMEII